MTWWKDFALQWASNAGSGYALEFVLCHSHVTVPPKPLSKAVSTQSTTMPVPLLRTGNHHSPCLPSLVSLHRSESAMPTCLSKRSP